MSTDLNTNPSSSSDTPSAASSTISLTPPGSIGTIANFFIFIAAFTIFVFIFNWAWHYSAKQYKIWFLKFSLSHKADWCSRVNSTIHALIICPGLILSMSFVKWRDSREPDSYDNLFWVHAFMAISAAYFLVDLCVILIYRVPMWMVFACHHIVALIPLLINLFSGDCPGGTFMLSAFLLVEIPVISLNIQNFLEQTGRGQTRAYAVCFYITYAFWFVFRIILPLYLLCLLWALILPSLPYFWCVAPGVVSAHLITIFCIGVFFFVLSRELRTRWKVTPRFLELAVVQPGVEGGVAMEDAPEFHHETLAGNTKQVPESHSEVEETSPRLPHYANSTKVNVEWGLGIDRPASVLRHGGSVFR